MNALAAQARVVLHFEVGGELLGLDVAAVAEITAATPLTRLPGAPAAVAGLGSLRARPLTVIDVAALYAPDSAPATKAAAFVVLADPWNHVALSVPALVELASMHADPGPGDGHPARLDDGRGLRLIEPQALVVAVERLLGEHAATPWT